MAQASELALCAAELRSAAQALTAAADRLAALDSEPAAIEPQPKPLTLEQVRTVLAEKSRAGHTAEIRTLLEAHGAVRLSDIDPKEYPALLTEAEALGNE